MLLAAPAAAETLRVEGIYGARSEIPPHVEVIAVEAFAGDWGYELSEDLADSLSAPAGDGEPFFQLVPASVGAAEADAALSGAAFTWIDERYARPRILKECVERNDKGKCIRKEERRIPCREMRVSYEVQAGLLGRDGSRLYDAGDLLQATRTYCADEFEPDPYAMLEQLAGRYRARLVGEFVPHRLASTPRLLEQRKGLSGNPRRAFKRALKLTKSNSAAACREFSALERDNPDHVSVLFNIGLCHESEDRLDDAELYYRRAVDASPDKSYPHEGLARIASRRRGAAQLAARGRPPSSD